MDTLKILSCIILASTPVLVQKTSDLTTPNSCPELSRRIASIEEKLDHLDLKSVVDELKAYIAQQTEKPDINTYSVYYAKKSWAAARADCQSRGMDLASINSMAEREHVLKLLTGTCAGYWVAARRSDTTNVWTWVNDNTVIQPEMWSDGQPDQSSTYGYLWEKKNHLLDDGGDNLCYICESTGPGR